jgi:hypothetical protein
MKSSVFSIVYYYCLGTEVAYDILLITNNFFTSGTTVYSTIESA